MNTMVAQDNTTLARTLYDAFSRYDFDSVLEYVSDDVQITLHALMMSLQGREGFRQMMELYKRSAPDGTVTVVRQLSGDEGVTNEATYRGTNTGISTGPGGIEIPATGKSFELDFCEVWRIIDGKIISLDNYADNVALMTQLGLMPVPEQAGA